MLSKFIELPIDAIVCRPQVRDKFDEESLASLARTIAEVGLQQPITVWRDGNEWVLFNGEMRLRAGKLAGEKTIRALVEDGELTPAEIRLRQLVANQHVDLTPLEKARAIESLMREAGWSASEVAAKLGLSPGTVSKLLAILSLPNDIQERIGSPGLGLTAAYQLTLAGNAEAQRRMASELSSGAMTRDGAAEQTKSRKKPRVLKRKRSGNGRDRIMVPLGGGRTVAVAGPGLTLDSLIEWIADFLEKLKGVHSRGVAMPEALKILASQA